MRKNILENIIRNVLFEAPEIKTVFMDAPNSVKRFADANGGTAFRVKVKQAYGKPDLNSIIEKLQLNKQYGRSSITATNKYAYIFSPDLKDADRKVMYNVLILPIKKVEEIYGVYPELTIGKIGNADIFQEQPNPKDAKDEKIKKLIQATNAVLSNKSETPASTGKTAEEPEKNTVTTNTELTTTSIYDNETGEPATTIQMPLEVNVTIPIKVPTGGFKYGVTDSELKKLQDNLKKNLTNANTPQPIKDNAAVKDFIKVSTYTGKYGPATKALVSFIKKGLSFKNDDGNVIEPEFVELLYKQPGWIQESKKSVLEQWGNFKSPVEPAPIQVIQPDDEDDNTSIYDTDFEAGDDKERNKGDEEELPKITQAKWSDDTPELKNIVQRIVDYGDGPKAKREYLLKTNKDWVLKWSDSLRQRIKNQEGFPTTFSWGGKIWNNYNGDWTKYTTDIIGKKIYGKGKGGFYPKALPKWKSSTDPYGASSADGGELIGTIKALSYDSKGKTIWFYIDYDKNYGDANKYYWVNHRDGAFYIKGYTRPVDTSDKIIARKSILTQIKSLNYAPGSLQSTLNVKANSPLYVYDTKTNTFKFVKNTTKSNIIKVYYLGISKNKQYIKIKMADNKLYFVKIENVSIPAENWPKSKSTAVDNGPD